jgi:integrase
MLANRTAHTRAAAEAALLDNTRDLPRRARALVVGEHLLFPDAPGLRLTRSTTRAFAWTYRYRSPLDGRMRQSRIGRWPALSYHDALSRWNALQQARADGHDPRLVARERVRAAAAAALAASTARKVESVTVADIVRLYTERGLVGTAKSQTTAKSALRHATERLGERSAARITRADAGAFLLAVKEDAPTVATQLRGRLRAVWDFAMAQNRLPIDTENPWIAPLSFKGVKSERDRVLVDNELAALLAKLDSAPFEPPVREALLLTLLTAARSGEVITMSDKTLDLTKGIWHLTDTKTGALRSVRLPRQAIPIARAYLSHDPITDQGDLGDAVREAQAHFGLANWKPHDLRRSARTGLSRLGVRTEVAEAALGHAKGGVKGTYDLHRFEAEVGEALQLWADHLDSLRAPQVVPLRHSA